MIEPAKFESNLFAPPTRLRPSLRDGLSAAIRHDQRQEGDRILSEGSSASADRFGNGRNSEKELQQPGTHERTLSAALLRRAHR